VGVKKDGLGVLAEVIIEGIAYLPVKKIDYAQRERARRKKSCEREGEAILQSKIRTKGETTEKSGSWDKNSTEKGTDTGNRKSSRIRFGSTGVEQMSRTSQRKGYERLSNRPEDSCAEPFVAHEVGREIRGGSAKDQEWGLISKGRLAFSCGLFHRNRRRTGGKEETCREKKIFPRCPRALPTRGVCHLGVQEGTTVGA